MTVATTQHMPNPWTDLLWGDVCESVAILLQLSDADEWIPTMVSEGEILTTFAALISNKFFYFWLTEMLYKLWLSSQHLIYRYKKLIDFFSSLN